MINDWMPVQIHLCHISNTQDTQTSHLQSKLESLESWTPLNNIKLNVSICCSMSLLFSKQPVQPPLLYQSSTGLYIRLSLLVLPFEMTLNELFLGLK